MAVLLHVAYIPSSLDTNNERQKQSKQYQYMLPLADCTNTHSFDNEHTPNNDNNNKNYTNSLLIYLNPPTPTIVTNSYNTNAQQSQLLLAPTTCYSDTIEYKLNRRASAISLLQKASQRRRSLIKS